MIIRQFVDVGTLITLSKGMVRMSLFRLYRHDFAARLS